MLDQHPEDAVISLDALTYAGSMANLADLEGHPRHRFVHGSITDAPLIDALAGEVDAIVNFAAETHVDRSLLNPEAFLATNVHGVYVLLEAARRHGSHDHPAGRAGDGCPPGPAGAARAGRLNTIITPPSASTDRPGAPQCAPASFCPRRTLEASDHERKNPRRGALWRQVGRA